MSTRARAGSGSGPGSGSSPATRELVRLGFTFTTHSYEHDPAATNFGEEAARALGVAQERVFKTLLAEMEGAASTSPLVVAIVPVSGRLDLKSLAHAVGGKRARMADPTLAERKTGYIVGGISPIGQRARLTTVLDHSALDFQTVLVSGGRRGLDIELAPSDLIRATSATTAALLRDPDRSTY